MRFCVNCEHHEQTPLAGTSAEGPHWCNRPIRQTRETDLVTGRAIVGPATLGRVCYDERRDPKGCGPHGIHYERKKK